MRSLSTVRSIVPAHALILPGYAPDPLLQQRASSAASNTRR